MLQFESIFKNHFDTEKISDDNLKKFTEDHIQRLTANNGGGTFTAHITATTLAHTAYFGKISTEDFALAVQQGLTVTVDSIIKNFKKSVSQKEGLIRSFYDVSSPTYQEFFPHGVTEYSSATKANIEMLMARMVSACIAHNADLGDAVRDLFIEYKDTYTEARNAQLLKFGEVDSSKSGTETARNTLEVQLMKNLFFVGTTFPGDVSRCMDFFKQDIIRYDENSATDGQGRLKGTITDAANGNPLIDAQIEILNTNIPIAKMKADGYKTQRMPTGSKQVRISFPGKTAQVIDVIILDDGDTVLNVDL